MKVPVLIGTAVCVLAVSATLAQAAPQVRAAPPNSADVQLHSYLQQATGAMHRGDLESAAENFRRALKIDPRSLAALNNLGIVLSRQGKPAEAIPFYQEALKVRPGDPATQRNLAVAYFKAQHYRSAWSLLQPMAVSNPKDFQILDLSGLCLFALDRYAEAAQYLERANQADPSDLETLDILGKAYLHSKDYKALTSVFARIMKLSPNSATAHIMMGTAYDQMSNRAAAIKEYQAAAQADPNFMGVHSGLGFLYWRQGDSDLAARPRGRENPHKAHICFAPTLRLSGQPLSLWEIRPRYRLSLRFECPPASAISSGRVVPAFNIGWRPSPRASTAA